MPRVFFLQAYLVLKYLKPQLLFSNKIPPCGIPHEVVRYFKTKCCQQKHAQRDLNWKNKLFRRNRSTTLNLITVFFLITSKYYFSSSFPP